MYTLSPVQEFFVLCLNKMFLLSVGGVVGEKVVTCDSFETATIRAALLATPCTLLCDSDAAPRRYCWTLTLSSPWEIHSCCSPCLLYCTLPILYSEILPLNLSGTVIMYCASIHTSLLQWTHCFSQGCKTAPTSFQTFY